MADREERWDIKSTRAMIGKPVLYGGKAIGHVSELELDEKLTCLKNVYVDGGIAGTRRIPGEQVRLLGEVSVLVDGKGRRGRPKETGLRRARSSAGGRVGAITGALLDEQSGQVRALELSRGFWDDLLSGRQWVFRYVVHAASGDVLIKSEGGEGE